MRGPSVPVRDRTSWVAEHRRTLGFVGLFVALTGLSMVLNPTHAQGMEWYGFSLFAVGAALLVWVAWPSGPVIQRETSSLGNRIIRFLSLHGRLIRLFPIFGVLLIAADLAYNFLLSSTPALLTEDIIVLLSAGALLAYGFMPARYSRERDFVLLFFLVLDFLLVLPLLVARLMSGSVDASVDAYSWAALAPELSAILTVLGVTNSVHAVAGFTAPGLTFTPVQMSTSVTVVITTACSGIYSFGVFASAFVAFVLTEYERSSRRLWLLLALGFAASYIANLLRMVVIVLVGYHADTAQTDLQSLLLAHSYAGWIIFLAWLALFWGLLFRLLPVRAEPGPPEPEETPIVSRRISRCAACGAPLSPAIAATRCACGVIYHRACLSTDGRCPACHSAVVGSRNGAAELP